MEIIVLLSIILLGILGSLTTIIIVRAKRKEKIDSKIGRISFRESMDLIDLPIITFINNGKKINFLLDTGASYSSVNGKALEGLSYENTNLIGSHIGIEGEVKDSWYIKMDITYNQRVYGEDFQVVDLEAAFTHMKKEHGVNLHGILGNSFFEKYKYVLNFKELTAYSLL